MKTAITTTAHRIDGWPIPLFASIRGVQQSVVNEIFSPTSLSLLFSRLQAVLLEYKAQGSVAPAATLSQVGPIPAVTTSDGTITTPADPNVYFNFAGVTGQTPFTVKALANS